MINKKKTIIKEKRDEERDILLQYDLILEQYNYSVAQCYEEEDNETQDEIPVLYNECDQLYTVLNKQREINQVAFTTICDNYCVFLFTHSPRANSL